MSQENRSIHHQTQHNPFIPPQPKKDIPLSFFVGHPFVSPSNPSLIVTDIHPSVREHPPIPQHPPPPRDERCSNPGVLKPDKSIPLVDQQISSHRTNDDRSTRFSCTIEPCQQNPHSHGTLLTLIDLDFDRFDCQVPLPLAFPHLGASRRAPRLKEAWGVCHLSAGRVVICV